MKILTRDQTEHDVDYVLASEAKQEIEETSTVLQQIHRDALACFQQMHSTANELRNALKGLLEEYDDRLAQYGTDYLWTKHEDKDVIDLARATYTKTTFITKIHP